MKTLAIIISAMVLTSGSRAQPIIGGASSTQLPVDGYFSPADRPAGGKFLNLSTRGWVDGTIKTMIAGMAVDVGNRIVLIRAVGPSLAAFGIADGVAKPVIELRDAKGVIATSVPWSQLSDADKTKLRAAAHTVGAFPLQENSNDAVLFAYLQTGLYTCVISGAQGTSGQVIVEAYDVPTNAVPGGVSPDPGNSGT